MCFLGKKTLYLVVLIFYSLPLISQIVPSWCENVEYDRNYVADEYLRVNGISNLLSDVQINYVDQERYFHSAVKLTGENGLSNASTLTFSYDTVYQTANFLYVHIIREGEIIDVLTKQPPKILHRERGLEYGVLNGRLTAYIEVKDLRVGDILEYSFVIKGFNPIIQNYVPFIQRLAMSAPIGKINVSVCTDGSDKYAYSLRNNAPEPKIIRKGELMEYHWEVLNPKVITCESDVPVWYNPYPMIEFFEKHSWEDISKYIASLFSFDNSQRFDYDSLLASIRRECTTKEEQVRYAIKYVQNNIRYLGEEHGIYSYKPRQPDIIIKNKAGDCKEKSWLLTCLIRDLGYEAYPVLVSTFVGHVLEEKSPSAGFFNHCISCFIIGKDTLFVDPTIADQGGKLKDIYCPFYEKGLLVKAGEKHLTNIPERNAGKIEIEEYFNIDSLLKPVRLNVKMLYTGENADVQRSLYKTVAINDIQNGYMQFYANIYPKMDIIGRLTYIDDYEKNIFQTNQSYLISDFWDIIDTTDSYQIKTSFFAKGIASSLQREMFSSRVGPMNLMYPLDIRESQIIDLPHKWKLSSYIDTVSGDGYAFVYSIDYRRKRLRLDYHYYTTQNYIEADQYKDFIERNAQIFSLLEYSLYHRDISKEEKDTNSKVHPLYIIIVILIVVILSMLAFKAFLYNPPVDTVTVFNGIFVGGWLIIPCIGLIGTTVFLAVGFFTEFSLDIVAWLQFVNPDSPQYNPLYGVQLFYQVILMLFLIVFGSLNTVLLFMKRSNFPIMMVVYKISLFVLVLVDFLLILFNTGDISFLWLVGITFVGAGIWGPYFLLSERVKGTFTKRLKRKDK